MFSGMIDWSSLQKKIDIFWYLDIEFRDFSINFLAVIIQLITSMIRDEWAAN